MAAIPVNILIDKGADYGVTFFITNKDGTPLNMSGYVGSAAMKQSYSATTSVPFTLEFVNRTAGEISLALTDVETSALDRRRYVYDIVLEDPNGHKTRVIMGNAEVSPGVS